MARNRNNGIRLSGRVVDLLMDGKKTVLASALVLVMALMWIRVLIGHRPKSAAADPQSAPAAPAERKVAVRSRIVELPKVPGRHDSILQDFFNMQNRACFSQALSVPDTSTDTEVPVVPPNRDEEVVQQVAGTLKLEAVLRSGCLRAFVNDRLLAVGDTFLVEHSTGPLTFEVLWIQDDAVLVECKGIQLTLKLASSMEVRK